MTQRLKRWESPRRQGRNDKGKGGSARQRQLKKQQQMLRKKLKEGQKGDNQSQQGGRDISSLPFFFVAPSSRHELPRPVRMKIFPPPHSLLGRARGHRP